jgi:hypothetical protein
VEVGVSVTVPGVGDVPVVWMPASDEDYRDPSENGGRGAYQPIAIVHHRIVGTLNSADLTFAANDATRATVGSEGRPVSANFGIGIENGRVEIHQYVDLSDTAYCNGDCRASRYPDQPSRWDGWYGHYGHNERTVSIEHHDNGGSTNLAIKGIVPEPVIKTSIALDRLMLSGDLAAIRAAGVRIRDQATATALGRIVPTPRTLIDHNDIGGPNKPYCWRPWKADTTGFPRARYVSELTAPAPQEEEDVPVLTTYTPGHVGTIKATANVRSAPKLGAATLLRTIPAGSTETWTATGYTKGDVDNGSDQWLCRWAGRWEYTHTSNVVSLVAPAKPSDVADARAKGITDAAAAAAAVK